MFRRARKRSSARTSAGPKARQKTTLPTAWAMLNGSDVRADRQVLAERVPPENVVNVDRSMIAPKSRPERAAEQRERHARHTARRSRRPSAAPSRPHRPQAAICHGVHGPWPKTRLDASAPMAPTAKPGAPPST